MTTQTIEQIEKIDKSRYRLNLWRTIALVLLVGGVLAQGIFPENGFVSYIYGIGAILTCVVNGAFIALMAKIRREPQLNEALNNEMFQLYTLKSALCGYYAMVASGLILGALTWVEIVPIPAKICCLGILFCGAVAQAIALLVYDRSR